MFKVLLKSDESTFVTERFRSMMEITYIFCITAHILMILNFFYQGLTELVLFNVFFTFPLISSALILNNKNKIQLAFMMIIIEFYTHQCLSIYFLGWKSGYQYFLIYLSVIPFFYPYWGKHFQVLISSATIFLYLVLLLTSTDSGVFQLSEHQYTISHIINCLLGVSLFILLTNYYVNNTTVREETLDQLVKEKTLQLKEGQRAAIYMLGEAGHFHDDATGSHIWRMAMYSKVLAKRCGWNDDDADLIELAAAMHDTGKIGVPDVVLKSPQSWMLMNGR
ncbi:HD domain-containing protein [Vibrio parahaemolyticus]|nr:HD domain-containing protein [Vibrio parahaemolyticus]